LYLRFTGPLVAGQRPAAADAMRRDRLAHWRQPVSDQRALLRFFDSSFLRRKPWVRFSSTVNDADLV